MFQDALGLLKHLKTARARWPFPDVEPILYSYAQLTSTIQIMSTPGALPTADQLQMLSALRSALHNCDVLGGGSMDIT